MSILGNTPEMRGFNWMLVIASALGFLTASVLRDAMALFGVIASFALIMIAYHLLLIVERLDAIASRAQDETSADEVPATE